MSGSMSLTSVIAPVERLHGLPTVLTDSAADGPNGPLMTELTGNPAPKSRTAAMAAYYACISFTDALAVETFRGGRGMAVRPKR